MEIFETKNYEIFNRLNGNRDIRNIKKIIDSIEKVGYIPNPIMVNENMEIIDGQNRYEALKELNLPIQYFIVNGVGINEARALNLGRTNWGTVDYVKSYAEDGNTSYQYLLKLMNDYPILKTQEIYGIATNKILTYGWVVNFINTGNFTLSRDEFFEIKKRLDYMNELKSPIKRMLGVRRLYVTTIAWCMTVPGVNIKRLCDVINDKYPLIRPAVDVNILLEDITRLYNSKLSKEKKVFFDLEYRTNY